VSPSQKRNDFQGYFRNFVCLSAFPGLMSLLSFEDFFIPSGFEGEKKFLFLFDYALIRPFVEPELFCRMNTFIFRENTDGAKCCHFRF